MQLRNPVLLRVIQTLMAPPATSSPSIAPATSLPATSRKGVRALLQLQTSYGVEGADIGIIPGVGVECLVSEPRQMSRLDSQALSLLRQRQ